MTGSSPRVSPALLGRLNGRRILEVLLRHAPASRADLVRRSGLSAPTVSKAVETLLEAGLLEEDAARASAPGRPARCLRPASRRSRVIGVVLDADRCDVLAAGLDGRIDPSAVRSFPTPASYPRLLDAVADRAGALLKDARILGAGLSMPGLIDRAEGRGLLSPNLHLTDGRTPARDLESRLGLPCTVRQESHGLCLAESFWGTARGLPDFAMLDASTGLGLGVMSGGRMLEGSSGLAGELGHLPAEPGGRPCGCGRRGCLETLASDRAFALAASEALGRRVDVAEAVRLLDGSDPRLRAPLDRALDGLAVAVSTVVNLFNPSTLILHGRVLESSDRCFAELRERVRARALGPSLERCRLLQARGSKQQGALAAAVDRLMESLAPRLAWNELAVS
jgi:predicted NBD/HSP70 family sugar kinase